MGITAPAYLAKRSVPPVKLHVKLVLTKVPVVAVYTTPKSKPASVVHAVTVNVKRCPDAAWCRESCMALATYCGALFVQYLFPPVVGKVP